MGYPENVQIVCLCLINKGYFEPFMCLDLASRLSEASRGPKPRTSHHRSTGGEREAWKEEALHDLPGKDERGSSSVSRTLQPFQRQRWKNV